MIPMAHRKDDIAQTNVRLFPLSPDAVRRLRRIAEVAEGSKSPTCRDEQTTTHADDLLRQLLQR